MRIRLLTVLCCSLCNVLATGAESAEPSTAIAAQSSGVGHPYRLSASDGRIITDETFLGSVQVVIFGYTNCPDVCPTTLSAAAGAVRALGADGRQVQILFISVDPRDTSRKLQTYAAAFGQHLIAMTGSKGEIDKAVEAFHASYTLRPRSDGGLDVSHTGLVYLFDRQGILRKLLVPTTSSERFAEELRRLL